MTWDELLALLAEHGMPERILASLKPVDAAYWEGFHDGLHGFILQPLQPPPEAEVPPDDRPARFLGEVPLD